MGNKHFLTAMYLRLSREDCDAEDMADGADKAGKKVFIKSESNSIKNQRELLRAYIYQQQDMELYDSYVDDGFSGSNFDRPEFKRMLSDIEKGRVNCVIVKDLSRFGRDYIESGRYIQKVFPALGVRFIALTDHYDSFYADEGESGILLPVKNFMNDSYCRDISAKVKSQFEIKRKNGEYMAPFALYGYRKAENNKHQLVIDEYAADVVKKIYEWKIEGAAVSAIAAKLNRFGILSPKEYKKFTGSNYKGGFSGASRAMWSSSSVKRILTDERYLGHLIQGKTEKINYKLKKSVKKPKEEWVRVENTHEPIISADNFLIVQNLLKSDSRVSPVTKRGSLFAGILFCGDCREQMIRRVNRCKDARKIFYICSTKNRGEGCTRHSIAEENLKEIADIAIRKYADYFSEKRKVSEKSLELEVDFASIARYGAETGKVKQERNRYDSLCRGLYEDLRRKIITKEEFERLYRAFKRKAAEFEETNKRQETMIKELLKNSVISAARLKAMQDAPELKEIDRHILCSMVKKIMIYENRRIEIVFYYTDPYRTANEEIGEA